MEDTEVQRTRKRWLALSKYLLDRGELMILVSPQHFFIHADCLVELEGVGLLNLVLHLSSTLGLAFANVLGLANIEDHCFALAELHRDCTRECGDARASLNLAKPCVELLNGDIYRPRGKCSCSHACLLVLVSEKASQNCLIGLVHASVCWRVTFARDNNALSRYCLALECDERVC